MRISSSSGSSLRPLTTPRRLAAEPPDQFTPSEPVPPMGLQPEGPVTRARFWAPAARQVYLVTPEQSVILSKGRGGVWEGTLELPLSQLEGQSYAFYVTDEQGRKSLRSDPYGRRLQGQLRGVSELYLHPQTGQEVHKFDKAGPVRFARMEVQQQAEADSVQLRLFEDGKPLDRAALQKRLGSSGAGLVRQFGSGLYWADACSADGRIALSRQGRDAWSTVLNRPQALAGLTYRFEVRRGGKLVGDRDGDGQLSAEEARQTPFNDAYGARLERLNDQRWSVVHCPQYAWKHPRPQIDPRRAVTYQLHVGSFLGEAGNARRSTFKDLIEKLDYFQELGVNQLELLPVNSFEGMRDWGYIGTSSLAMAEQYGFVAEDGRWVCGVEAIQRFVDEAHGRGVAVLNDVVYNHWGGDFNNLWELDGKANSYFNWGQGLKHTPWGPMPAYNQPQVRELIKRSVLQQFDELGFDGLRFDFTHPMHDQKEGGGDHGWSLLREITSEVRQRHPGAFLAAEEFPNHPILTTPVEKGGAGFDAMWNTEFQHRLLHDHWNPSIIQQAVAGRPTDIDKFMRHLTQHPGFGSEMESVTVISNHDEVGNADRTITVTSGGKPAGKWERALARLAFATGMFSPGRPIFFQGEETLAENPFRWGVPSTWDTGCPTEEPRVRHFEFCKDAIALRKSLPGLAGDVPAEAIYSSNEDSVFAFRRGEDLVVIGSVARQARTGYRLPLPPGRWELVLSTDAAEYGGFGVGRSQVQGGPDSRVDLPAGGLLLYRRIPASAKPEIQ